MSSANLADKRTDGKKLSEKDSYAVIPIYEENMDLDCFHMSRGASKYLDSPEVFSTIKKRKVNITKNSGPGTKGYRNCQLPLHQKIMEYDIDPYEFSVDDESILIEYSIEMLRHYHLLDEFNIREHSLRSFFDEVRKLYKQDNEFHNFKHVWCVMHLSFQILIRGADKYLTSLDVLAVLLAAICHDIAHPGNNNAFEVATQTELSKIYAGDGPPCILEKHHVKLTRNLLTNEFGQDMLRGLNKQQKEALYAQIFQIIMATDMARHSEIVKEAQLYTSPLPSPTSPAQMTGFTDNNNTTNSNGNSIPSTPRKSQRLKGFKQHVNRHDPESRVRFTRVIVHTADLGAQTQCLMVAYRWADRCYEEFRAQAEKERKLNIVTSANIHAIELDSKKYADQAAFIEFFLEPLWKAVSDFLPELRFAYDQLVRNKESYRAQVGVEASKEELARSSSSSQEGSHPVNCSSHSSDMSGDSQNNYNSSSQNGDRLHRHRCNTIDEEQPQVQVQVQPGLPGQSQAMEGVSSNVDDGDGEG